MARAATPRPDMVGMLIGATLLVAVLFAPLMAFQSVEAGSQVAAVESTVKPSSGSGSPGLFAVRHIA